MTFAADVTAQVELRVQELLATPEGRASTAKHLALLEVNDYRMGDYVTGMLPRVAPQWDDWPEERNRLFEELQAAVRTGVDPLIDDAVAALVEARPDPAVFSDIDPDTSSPRRLPPACEADTGGTE